MIKVEKRSVQGGQRVRILVIEDDETISSFVSKGLKQAGYAVDQAFDGETGLHLAITELHDVVVLDRMLPGFDGLHVLEEMRRQRRSVPVIILSAKGSVDDRVKGLESGADDYLTKPFAFSELLARVQALMRRASGKAETTRLTVADLSMDLLTREVARSGCRIELQPREFALLEYLMRNADRVVSKTMIMEHVWDYNFDPQTNVIEVRISKLRDKIDRNFERKLIHTIRGAGYALRESP